MESQEVTSETQGLNNLCKQNVKSEEINFDADIGQLMNLIINAFYSKKEIFVRELLSNASDALEKIRYEALKDKTVLDTEENLKIKIWVDNKQIIIEDTGIGMTKSDLVNNLGTIAKSGTKSFLEKVKSSEDSIDQIGQFGVGFYSAFLVSDKVTIYTKNNNECEYIWQSSADKSYTITENTEPLLKRGTRIILNIKEDENEYLDVNVVKNIIKKYNQFINFPIELQEIKEIEEEVNEELKCKECKTEDDSEDVDVDVDVVIEDKDSDDENLNEKKKITKKVVEWNVVNDQKPIWSKNPSEISEEEYQQFYKSITDDYSNSISKCHFKAEGSIEFDCLLYIPERSQYELFDSKQKNKNIKLYVKKIFIMEDCEELVPEWLRFMKGIVDSKDIPLNVSREILQQNRVLKHINKIIVKKSIELFNSLTEDKEKYLKFYNNYSKMIKLGAHEDNKNRDKLLKLLRFYSSNNVDEYISFDEYVENMQEGQNKIYYITGLSKQSLICSPFIEKLKEKNFNVLLFIDPIDEYMFQNTKEYEGKKLVDVSKEGNHFNDNDLKEKEEEFKEVISFLSQTLENRIESVKVSDRLINTPCVIAASEYGWSANMERIIKAQALRNEEMDNFMGSRKILEVNFSHIILKTLKEKLKNEDNKEKCKNMVFLIYETAMINSGFNLEKPSLFADKVNKLVEFGFCDISNLEGNESNSTEQLNSSEEESIVKEEMVLEQVD